MLRLTGSLSLVFLTLLSSTHAHHSYSFENTAIVRQVDLAGSLVQVVTTYAVKALEKDAKAYTIALSPNDKEKTSWLEAKVKGQQQALPVRDHGKERTNGYHLLDVELPKPLGLNETLNIVLETIQTHAAKPWPAAASQNDEQSLLFNTDLFVISPYQTLVQRSKLRSPTPRIVEFTEPKDLEAFTLDTPATKSGATITYGPFNNIPPSADENFLAKTQQPVSVQYMYDNPVLEVSSLKRAAEISHWGSNLNIQDEIRLRNGGPELKGHFSRLDHQAQAFYKRPSPHVIPGLSLHLPAGIRNTYFYDIIGNVSTSHLRVAPAPPKSLRSRTPQYSVLDLRPRYPLLGGWNYTFTLGWDSDLSDSAVYDSKTGKYIVKVPVMTLIPGAVVNKAEVTVILPEGATDVDFSLPWPAVSTSSSTVTTYLDTTGRPALTFVYERLTTKHDGDIYVSYKVPFSAHLKKPTAVATAFMGLFVLTLIGRRINLSLHPSKTA
ncbi:dolichyl-diphosphooligosaccharide--protein glycosyltransferase subunit 1 [Pleurotus pulmonarius]|nr:dolichyl-diphosphooligosaccharide--protein glycosyltransferase subunit 1 [Pleurotus pulmonarius]